MAADVFGDSSLFSEFDKDRETQRFLDNCEAEDIVETPKIETNDTVSRENDSNSTDCSDGSDHAEPISLAVSQNDKMEVDEDETPITPNDVTSHKVIFERNKYHSFAKIIDTTRYVPDERGAAIQILYQNSNFSRKHREEIEGFIQNLMERDQRDEYMNGPEFLPKLNLKASTPTSVDINNLLPTSKRTAEMWDAHAIIGCSQFHNLFMVDSRGWPITPNCQQESMTITLVKFEKHFEVPLPVDVEDLKIVKMDQKKKASCFNCDGEHNMSECKEPKDFGKIRENRRKFQENNVSSVPKLSLSKNYSDFEESSRFKKFKPGQISKELYSAMGINTEQLPSYIYKMRVLGYPPGWLQRAKTGYSSGIVIFDRDGKETNLKDETLEDGEINSERIKEEIVEIEKIIEYPGFTVPVPDDVIDEWQTLNMPPLQKHQLKQTLEQQVNIQEDAKKRKADEVEKIEKKRIRLMNKEADMEMSDEEEQTETSGCDSDFLPPLPVDTPPGKPPIPAGTPPITPGNARKIHRYHPTLANLTPPQFNEDRGPPIPDYTPPCKPPLPDGTPPPTPPVVGNFDRNISKDSNRSGSPSFQSLQDQYQNILSQLNDDSSSQSDTDVKIIESIEVSEDSDASVIFVPTLKTQSSEVSEVSPKLLSRTSSTVSIQSLDEFGFSRGISKVKEYGTPILEASTSVSTLPNRDKFKQGAEDHLLFQNLAGSTGTFSKMRELIGKIKSKFKSK